MRPLTQRAMEPTKASFATTQWDQEVESATAPDGHVRVHQSQAAPFSVGLPSGLARSQQLYMMQRFLNIPATPSYVAKDDGLVLDRVVVNVGGRSWWQTLTLRLRAQRAWNTQEFSKGKPHQVLGDPSMYALGGRFHVGFGAHTVLRGLGELGSLSGAVEDFRRFKKSLSRFGGVDADASRAANAQTSNDRERDALRSGDDTLRGRLTLQTKAFAGHLVSFDASLRERYQTPRKYIDGPSFVGASVQSRGPRWFNYRLGVRQWLEDTLPAFEMSDLRLVLRPPPRREATLGCSVEHQTTLWRGRRRAARGRGRRPGGYAALPQTPCVVVGGLVGATARLALADDVGSTDGDADGDASNVDSRASPALARGDVDHRHCLSLAAHAGVGSFARPLLDYTALDLRYDLGSTSGTSSLSANPAPSVDARDAPKTAMERMVAAGFDGRVRVERETVTAGITQQILGPVRARAELRFSPGTAGRAYREGWRALTRPRARSTDAHAAKQTNRGETEDPSLPPRAPRGKPPPRPGSAAAAKAAAAGSGASAGAGRFGDAWRAARGEMSGAELVYGIDCPLPPALGAARLVAWYNVNRGEAQAEMRLFDL